MRTYNDIYLDARKRLRAAGIAANGLEGWLIMSRATGKTREEFLSSSRLYATDGTVEKAVEDMLRRRLGGEPVAYIVGEWEFYGLPLTIDNSVMIPRVDTEVLADEAIALLKRRGGHSRLLDLCAGSGCIGLAVAANAQPCRVLLADNSQKALKLCRANAVRNNLTRSITAIEADALDSPPALLGQFDVIVSNPPYIPSGDIPGLDNSVRCYEPEEALDGGLDGLRFYRAITSRWTSLLKPDGFLAVECGIGQANDVRRLMAERGLIDIYTREDTLGIERVVVGRNGT